MLTPPITYVSSKVIVNVISVFDASFGESYLESLALFVMPSLSLAVPIASLICPRLDSIVAFNATFSETNSPCVSPVVAKDTIYFFNEKTGLKKIAENTELSYNHKNIVDFWKK